MANAVMSGLDRRDFVWLIAGTGLIVVFGLVAYDQLFNLHFAAWRLYENQPTTTPLANALRGPVTGWYRPVTVLVSVLGGLAAVMSALRGHWKPFAALVGLIIVLIVGIEVTQGAGQGTTPTSEVDNVATISVVWTALLGLVPLGVLITAATVLRKQPDDL